MPVITIRAVTVDKAEMKDAYQTPVYKTERRQGLTLVHFSAQRKHILLDTSGA
jgi:hypothetical protein